MYMASVTSSKYVKVVALITMGYMSRILNIICSQQVQIMMLCEHLGERWNKNFTQK